MNPLVDQLKRDFQESLRIYSTSSGSNATYHEGKMVAYTTAVAYILNIEWVAAALLLRKES